MESIDSLLATLARSAARGTVMVVDDNPENLKLMEEMLLSSGYEVRSLPSGSMALAAAGENPPDLILLDVNMPDMNGYDVCERLKSSAQLREVPVIFLSAMNTPEDRLRGFRSGGVDYVSKPFQLEEVQARVDAHVRLRRLHQAMQTDNCSLQELVRIQVRRLADAQLGTIFAIAKLAEVRDDETGTHLERVQAFCRLMAVGFSAHPKYKTTVDGAWIANIVHASPLHDIGKVAIPDRILLKPGPLTPDEFAIMKTHATLGAQTLQTVNDRYPDNEFIAMGIDLARSHHEWWDGTGYPDGLAGEEIPLCARILAVADCYDAIRSRRFYKPAIRHDETCEIIFRDSGKHFDPAVIAIFGELADMFRDVWNRMAPIPEAAAASPVEEPSIRDSSLLVRAGTRGL
jgi:putative two-component system response regulator